MVTVEINTGFIMALMILSIIYLIIQYWCALQELHQYERWYVEENRENLKLKEKLFQHEKKEDDDLPRWYIKCPDGTIKRKKEEGD